MSQPDKSIAQLLRDSEELAKSLGHKHLTPDHLFVNILKDEKISKLFTEVNVDSVTTAENIVKSLDENLPKSEVVNVQRQREIAIIMSEASKISRSEDRNVYDIGDVFVATFVVAESTSIAGAFIKQFFGSSETLREFVDEKYVREPVLAGDVQHEEDDKKSPLKRFCTSLNEKAKAKQLQKAINREIETSLIIETLKQKKKNNPILVGEPGVGKTAIVEGIAFDIVNGAAPEFLKNVEIFELDLTRLVAGTKYRGEFESRIEGLVNEVLKINSKGKRRIVLFVDEIHMLVGAGSASSSMDASNIIKPALARGELSLIGGTTFDEYREVIEKEKALNRRFNKVTIQEPSKEDAFKIIKNSIEQYTEHHNVVYTDEIIKKVIHLADFHIHDKFLPDSAFSIIDAVGSKCSIKNPGVKYTVKSRDIDATLSAILSVPEKFISDKNATLLLGLEDRINENIYGQEKSVVEIAKYVRRYKAGLGNPKKPGLSSLLTGPSGVGKTEFCIQLAQELGINFFRIDMSEYMNNLSVTKLLGSEPGFVGSDQGGILSNEIRQRPHTLLLLDEVEKAHPRVMDIFLQVFDNGILKDGQGRDIDFRHTLIFMTSNLGTKSMKQLGFSKTEGFREDREIKNFFRPEMINRIDLISKFNPLSKETLNKIVSREINKLNAKLKENKQRFVVECTENAINYIIECGYNEEYGAREIQRTIDKLIQLELSTLILSKSIKSDKVLVDYIDSEIKFNY